MSNSSNRTAMGIDPGQPFYHDFVPKPHPYESRCSACNEPQQSERHRMHQASFARQDSAEGKVPQASIYDPEGVGLRGQASDVSKASGTIPLSHRRPKVIVDENTYQFISTSLRRLIDRAQNLGDLDREYVVNEALQIEHALADSKQAPEVLPGHMEKPKNFAEEIVSELIELMHTYYQTLIPDIHLDEYLVRNLFSFLQQKDRCLPKVRPGEPIFVLRAQDVTAPTMVAKWVEMNRGTAHREKILTALDDVIQMYQWQRDNYDVVKRAD